MFDRYKHYSSTSLLLCLVLLYQPSLAGFQPVIPIHYNQKSKGTRQQLQAAASVISVIIHHI